VLLLGYQHSWKLSQPIRSEDHNCYLTFFLRLWHEPVEGYSLEVRANKSIFLNYGRAALQQWVISTMTAYCRRLLQTVCAIFWFLISETIYRVDLVTWNQYLRWGVVILRLHSGKNVIEAQMDKYVNLSNEFNIKSSFKLWLAILQCLFCLFVLLSKLLRFEQYTSTRLLAQFDEDLSPIQKISLRIVTGNVIGPRYKIRLLRIRITPLENPNRWITTQHLLFWVTAHTLTLNSFKSLMLSIGAFKNSKNSDIAKYCNNLKEVFTILLYFYVMYLHFNAFKNVIYSCDGKAEFLASFQSLVSWSFRNHSDNLVLKTRFLLLSVLKSVVLLLCKLWYIHTFFGISW